MGPGPSGSLPMRPAPVCALLLPLALVLAGAPARAYEQTVAEPGYTVRAPALADTGLDIVLQAEPVPQVGSTRVCAGRFLRGLVRRPNMPDRDRIHRAPLDESTFLVLYILEAEGRRTLHAHLLGVLEGSHCLEAHFSRPMQDGDDTEAWRQSFAGASIRPSAR